MIELGKPLSAEHKKKISEALQRALPGPYKDIATPTLGSFYENDPEMQKYQKSKQTIQSQIANLKTVMETVKGKQSSMSKSQKKAFA